MASENTSEGRPQDDESASENTTAALAAYLALLARAPLSAETVRTYTSKVRGYLTWLQTPTSTVTP